MDEGKGEHMESLLRDTRRVADQQQGEYEYNHTEIEHRSDEMDFPDSGKTVFELQEVSKEDAREATRKEVSQRLVVRD